MVFWKRFVQLTLISTKCPSKGKLPEEIDARMDNVPILFSTLNPDLSRVYIDLPKPVIKRWMILTRLSSHWAIVGRAHSTSIQTGESKQTYWKTKAVDLELFSEFLGRPYIEKLVGLALDSRWTAKSKDWWWTKKTKGGLWSVDWTHLFETAKYLTQQRRQGCSFTGLLTITRHST